MEKKEKLPPTSPGEILKLDLLEPNNLSVPKLAREINVPSGRIYDIINAKRAVTADTDLRLCKYFGITPGLFLRLQAEYELELAQDKIEEELKDIKPMELLENI